MVDDYDAFKAGWAACAAAAEDMAVRVFLPSGGSTDAVLVNHLSGLRAMPAQAKEQQ